MGLPERTQDDTMVFTAFIIADMIQVYTITNYIIPPHIGGALFIACQADRRAV